MSLPSLDGRLIAYNADYQCFCSHCLSDACGDDKKVSNAVSLQTENVDVVSG